jgi:ascorbate-specific PTS system EIIC-type component UlaA
MSNDSPQQKIKEAGFTAWRLAILGVATLLILILYLGMAYLVFLDRMTDGPLILLTGVILGYILRSVQDWA